MAIAVILSADPYFKTRLSYELEGLFTEIAEALPSPLPADAVCFLDRDTAEIASPPRGAVTFSRRDDADLPIPYRLGAVRERLLRTQKDAPRLSLLADGHTAVLGKRTVHLSDGEFALLSRLLRAEGDYVSRETLLAELWEGEDGGILNVYIHYLRKKLETENERVILSSRGRGYAVNPAYLLPSALPDKAL